MGEVLVGMVIMVGAVDDPRTSGANATGPITEARVIREEEALQGGRRLGSLPWSWFLPLTKSDTSTEAVGVGADVGVCAYGAERANIVVIHTGAARTPRWRERHKIKHGRDLSENKKKEKEKDET